MAERDERWLLVLIACIVVLCAFAFMIGCAFARDPSGIHANSPHHDWYEHQHNVRGEWCCNESDAHPYYGGYALNADGSVTVEGETIPKEQVLTSANPTGHAVWWYVDLYKGKRTYCFAVGSGA